MKKLALGALFVGLAAACGGGNSNPMLPDSGMPPDSGPVQCSPTAQTGCDPGQKCTWIVDNEEPRISHVGCVDDGTVEAFGTCTRQPPAAGGADDCKAGNICLSGMCKPICDTNGGEPVCPTNYACVRYADVLEDGGGNSLGGACEPGCDPLTQKLLVGGGEACGSPDPAAPTLGCYGGIDFSCSRAGDLDKVDGTDPRENGVVYLNSCAPGYLPIFDRSTTDQTTICNGLCAAQPIDNTRPAPVAIAGNPSEVAKLPTSPAAMAGDGTCAATKKGRGGQSTCIYYYPRVQDSQTGEIPAAFETYTNKLGICLNRTDLQIDFDQNPATDPEAWGMNVGCQGLPPTSADPNTPWMGADFWWCQPAEPAALTGTQQRKRARAPFSLGLEEIELRRHVLR